DSVAAARAFLALHSATRDRAWLERAEAAVLFVARRFRRGDGAGFDTASARGPFDRPGPQRDENVVLARAANLLFRLTGRAEHREVADQAWRYLSRPEVARAGSVGGPLLVERERRLDGTALASPGASTRWAPAGARVRRGRAGLA
ncbi:MAG TPA: hypothetical protein VII13_14735, partial [Vicinamibacteria bacterium]